MIMFCDSVKILLHTAKTLSTIINLIIDFWSLILEEKVDFSKVVKKSEKIFPSIESLENQVNDSLMMETFSTIKIMKIYCEYIKLIMHDHKKAIMINDYKDLLNKKFS